MRAFKSVGGNPIVFDKVTHPPTHSIHIKKRLLLLHTLIQYLIRTALISSIFLAHPTHPSTHPLQVKGAYAWDVDGNKYVDCVGLPPTLPPILQ